MFKGFSDSETFSQFPDAFFRQLLPEITALDELKITLYALWRIEHMDGSFRALAEADFDAHDLGLGPDEIRSGLQATEKRGSLLKSVYNGQALYFVNSSSGRTAAQAFAEHGWPYAGSVVSAPLERPNAFRLYEENIGPLTPLIADALNDAEATFSAEWVADAIEVAVKRNARSWKYCEAVLRRWKEEGRAEKQNGRDDQASRQHDVEDKIKKFVGGGAG
jgi:DnaD/phage-associated family protein